MGFLRRGGTILATDSEPHMIERAQRARYPPGALRELPADWVECAFRGEGGHAVAGKRKMRAVWGTHRR